MSEPDPKERDSTKGTVRAAQPLSKIRALLNTWLA